MADKSADVGGPPPADESDNKEKGVLNHGNADIAPLDVATVTANPALVLDNPARLQVMVSSQDIETLNAIGGLNVRCRYATSCFVCS